MKLSGLKMLEIVIASIGLGIVIGAWLQSLTR
jgi:hypothetical protein